MKKDKFENKKEGVMQCEQKNILKSTALIKALLVGAWMLVISIPLFAQEKTKLNLPDGVYQNTRSGCAFIAKANQIYSVQEAIKKFGTAKLNQWFAGKKYKVILGGEVIGEGYNKEIPENYKPQGFRVCRSPFQIDRSKPNYIKEEKIIRMPLYSKDSIFRRYGSAIQQITVPDAYKENTKQNYRLVSPNEVALIEQLAADQLLLTTVASKKIARYKFSKTDVIRAELLTLDKVLLRNQETYIGVFYYEFKFSQGSRDYKVVFHAKGNIVKPISGYDNEMAILGMMDVDGCGEDELIVQETKPMEDGSIDWLEIFKQNKNGSWDRIFRSKEICNSNESCK